MAVSEVIAHIDAEIAKLQQARTLLSGGEAAMAAPKARRGRPKGSKNLAAAAAPASAAKRAKGKRTLSPEGRKAIADAMKRRWAERKKEAAK